RCLPPSYRDGGGTGALRCYLCANPLPERCADLSPTRSLSENPGVAIVHVTSSCAVLSSSSKEKQGELLASRSPCVVCDSCVPLQVRGTFILLDRRTHACPLALFSRIEDKGHMGHFIFV